MNDLPLVATATEIEKVAANPAEAQSSLKTRPRSSLTA